MKKIFIFITILCLQSCSKMATINLEEHKFGRQPTKIFWIQVPGLSDEHLAFLKFFRSLEEKIPLEENTCVGRLWNYNLYKFRSSVEEGLMAQITGSMNIKGQCSDLKLEPIWSKLGKFGFYTGIIENGGLQNSLYDLDKKCSKEVQPFLEHSLLWKIKTKENKKSLVFKLEEGQEFVAGTPYFSAKCVSNDCFDQLIPTTKMALKYLNFQGSKVFLIIRDFNYYTAFSQGKIGEAKDRLIEILRLFHWLKQESRHDDNTLVLLTTSGGLRIKSDAYPEIPQTQMSTQQIYKESLGLSNIYVSGARSENFCGMYNETEVVNRILKNPVQQVDLQNWKQYLSN